jgi:dTDP-glucose pyrophosphorylase
VRWLVSMSETPIQPSSTLMEAVRAIEISHRRIAIVADENNILLGTLTDGDIRRCLLAGGSLATSVVEAMNEAPLTAAPHTPVPQLMNMMRRRKVLALPIIDEDGHFIRLVHLGDLDEASPRVVSDVAFAFAVIMAGGEGTRLRPITETLPKPMVDIGGVPLLERQITRLAKVGIRRVYLSVNYLSHIIEEYFGDGRSHGVEICYLREKEKLGTAGALSMLPEVPTSPIIVMNGDILTTTDFRSLYSFHIQHGALVTVSAVDHHVNIPYGVITSDGPFVKGLLEKPSQRFLCNAGIYALSPDALRFLGNGVPCNMTDIVSSCLSAKELVAVFPMHEYWSDIGTPDDLERARSFFHKLETQDD